jgi:SAM-dependent methyltransferase
MIINPTGYWEDTEKLYHVRCEPLCDWIINFLKDFKDYPLYDFGCGNGHYSKKIEDAGFKKVTGFEGKISKFSDFNNIIQQDLTQPFSLPDKGNCLFLEVAEHIPVQFENIMLDNIINSCNNKLIMSWAIRGQDGAGHINCLNNDEVINKITNKGMIYLPQETISARNSIPNDNPYFWFKNTTLIFTK